MKQLSLITVTVLLLMFADAGTLSAGDGFFSRLNPLRWFRTPAADTARTSQHQALIRSKLADRGIDPDLIDERIARVTAARNTDARKPSGNRDEQTGASAAELRTKLENNGITEDQIDARIARVIDTRNQAADRIDGFHPPTGDAVGSRIGIREISPDEAHDRKFLGPPVPVPEAPPQPSGDVYRWNRLR